MSWPPHGEYQFVHEMYAQPPGRSVRSISAITSAAFGVCSSRFEQNAPSTDSSASGRSPASASSARAGAERLGVEARPAAEIDDRLPRERSVAALEVLDRLGREQPI